MDAPKEPLLATREGAILTLTLNRPDAKNALDEALTERLLEELTKAGSDARVRVVVLRGANGVFSSGGDIRSMLARQGKPLATKARQEKAFGPLARAILALPKPVIAQVNGDAYGAGLALALACDLAYAHEDARLGLTFARLALGPDTGASWTLTRLVGLRAAKEMILLADVITGERAVEIGLVNAAGKPEEVAHHVTEIAKRLAEGPTGAYALQKQALLRGAFSDLDQALATEANLQACAFTLDDHKEGVQAFLEKRPPRFQGT